MKASRETVIIISIGSLPKPQDWWESRCLSVAGISSKIMNRMILIVVKVETNKVLFPNLDTISKSTFVAVIMRLADLKL